MCIFVSYKKVLKLYILILCTYVSFYFVSIIAAVVYALCGVGHRYNNTTLARQAQPQAQKQIHVRVLLVERLLLLRAAATALLLERPVLAHTHTDKCLC